MANLNVPPRHGYRPSKNINSETKKEKALGKFTEKGLKVAAGLKFFGTMLLWNKDVGKYFIKARGIWKSGHKCSFKLAFQGVFFLYSLAGLKTVSNR